MTNMEECEVLCVYRELQKAKRFIFMHELRLIVFIREPQVDFFFIQYFFTFH